MAKKKDAIQKKQGETDVSLYVNPEETGDDGFGDDEDFLTMPILSLLQSNSPPVEDERGKAGSWWHTVTEQEYDTTLFVPAYIQRVYAEFTRREDGGGFHGHHAPDSEIVKRALEESTEFGKYVTSDGHELVDTYHLYGVVCDESQPIAMAVVLVKRTGIKSFKQWRNRLRMYRLNGRRTPLTAHLTMLAAVKRRNEKGSFYVPTFEPAIGGDVHDSLLQLSDPRRVGAEEVKDMVVRGVVRVEPEEDSGGDDAGIVSDDERDEAFG